MMRARVGTWCTVVLVLGGAGCAAGRAQQRGEGSAEGGVLARVDVRALPAAAAIAFEGDDEPGTQRLIAVATGAQYEPLRLMRWHVDWRAGTVRGAELAALADPSGLLPFALTHSFSAGRVLTGADLDVRGLAPDGLGGFWLLDAKGPLLLRVDGSGRIAAPPTPIPVAPGGPPHVGPRSPLLEEGALLHAVNALRGHAAVRGARPPLVTVEHVLLADGDPATVARGRERPPEGRPPASSELVDLAAFHRAGYRVVPWTVNAPARMRALIRLGVDGLITDSPHLLHAVLREERPEVFLPDARVDRSRFDLQAHRGARTVRPENTLPSFEYALEALAPTLETDLGLSADGVPFISHDPVMEAGKCRRADGKPYPVERELVVRLTSAADLQRALVCDRLLPDWPDQANDAALSPVSVAFAQQLGLAHPYTPLTLGHLLAFPGFFAAWYENGPGATHPAAAARAANARAVWFNLEPKAPPHSSPRDPDAGALTRAALAEVARHRMQDRVILQSFNWHALLHAHEADPSVQTGALIGASQLAVVEDGRSPAFAGLPYPLWRTHRAHPATLEPGAAMHLAVEEDAGALLVELGPHALRFEPRPAHPSRAPFAPVSPRRCVVLLDGVLELRESEAGTGAGCAFREE